MIDTGINEVENTHPSAWKMMPGLVGFFFFPVLSTAFQFDLFLFLFQVTIKTRKLITIEHALHKGELWKFLSYF